MLSRSQRLHPASRIPIAAHNPHLLRLVSQAVSDEMIEYVTRHTMDVIHVVGEAAPDPSDSSAMSVDTATGEIRSAQAYISLFNFISQLVRACNVQVGTLLTTIIYLERLRAKLTPSAKGTHWECTRHRVFLAALIVAAKYLNDSSPKNIHWQRYAQLFDVRQINIMEYQMLFILDYDLRFDELEACTYFSPFMTSDAQVASTRALAVDRVSKASKARSQALQQTQQQSPPSSSSSTPAAYEIPPRESRQNSSSSSSAKRSSTLQLPVVTPSPMQSTLSTDSSCSALSSEMGSLVDDTGSSSSGSSSGWTTSDSESETEDYGAAPRIVYSVKTHSYDNTMLCDEDGGEPMVVDNVQPKRLFQLQPLSLPTKYRLQQDRSRIPSDTSSVCTVTNHRSPSSSVSLSALHHHPRRASAAKRSSKDWNNVPSSTTMPALTTTTTPLRTGVSRGFLSRMWGAAKAQALGGESMANGNAEEPQRPSGLRRLVLVHARSGSRGAAGLDV